jgi:hypothetical protein
MTGEGRFMERAFRIADYYLLHKPLIEQEVLYLRDHGCEVIGGLSEAYVLAAHKDPERHERWKPAMHALLDRILEAGRTEHGMFVSKINPVSGEWVQEDLTDNWGYDYNAILAVHALGEGGGRYREAVRFVLSNLMHCKDHVWEGGSADGIADSLEGAINLLNRVPEPAAAEWADYMAQRLFAKQRDTGVVEGWHGDGNFARTALMYALWKSAGAYVEPWRADVRVGAVVEDGGVAHFTVESDWPWSGTLRFDVPRHKEWLHLPLDYPRLNQFPEWYTIEEGERYAAEGREIYSGAALRKGVPVSSAPDQPFTLSLRKVE